MQEESDVTVFVCTACRQENDADNRPGAVLFEELRSRLATQTGKSITLKAVECLGVCKRPCTVALAGPDKWTYVIGDLDQNTDVDEIIASALSFAASDNGIVPWKERPQSFRKGVVSRVPPLNFTSREGD